MSEAEQILGELEAAGVLGAEGGLDIQYGINAAAELISRGVKTDQDNKANAKSKQQNEEKLAAAIRADVAWANSEVALETAPSAGRQAAQILVQSAQSMALSAGAGLAPEYAAKRLQSAQQNAQSAAQKALAAPTSAALGAAMRAWQKVAAMVASTGGSGSGSTALTPYSPPNFWTKKLAGIPTWGWFVGVPVLTTGLVLAIRALRK